LHQHDASRLGGTESANPLVVTLATPFVEVQHADFGLSPTFIRVAVFFVIWIPLWGLAKAIFPREFWNVLPSLIGTAVTLILLGFIYWYWFSQRATARRQNQVEALRDATRLGDRVSAQAQRLLIIRAIDDEASLVLALGTIGNYITTRAIKYVLWIILAPISLILIPVFEEQWYVYEGAVQVGCSALILILLSLLSVARTAHGRELAVSPMELQINTQSAPDATGLSEIVTLVRRTYVKSLRHGIYDHEDCAKTISDWVRSRLCARPAC
jgi:preprotein translocase subunit YajC